VGTVISECLGGGRNFLTAIFAGEALITRNEILAVSWQCRLSALGSRATQFGGHALFHGPGPFGDERRYRFFCGVGFRFVR
jgi:hypothetical protein